MRPSDRTIRDVLRREAANVTIPDDMWKNISQKLDEDAVKQERRKRLVAQGHQWRPAMILAVAAGFFWFALIPTLPDMGTTFPVETNTPPVVAPAGQPDPYNTPRSLRTNPNSTRRDGEGPLRTVSTVENGTVPNIGPGPAMH